VRDTVWTFGASGTANNRSNWVNNRLWIRGTFATYQTWGCADTMFLIDDILLENTPVGSDPANNNTDVVGLVSEKSIVIKYGYRSPVDTLRHHDTCGPDTGYGGIWIYAAMAALGDGHGNTHQDGVFTFEYQHPHPSVPDYRYNNVLYTKIDLHRYHFPQSNAYKWATCNGPRNLKIDYPGIILCGQRGHLIWNEDILISTAQFLKEEEDSSIAVIMIMNGHPMMNGISLLISVDQQVHLQQCNIMTLYSFSTDQY
jgi:hypothetical protein